MADNPAFDPGEDKDDPAHDKKAEGAKEEFAPQKGEERPRKEAEEEEEGPWWRRALGAVTVEPIIFAFYVSMSQTGLGIANLLLYKECWPDGPPLNATLPCDREDISQREVAQILAWKPIVMHSLSLLSLALAGSWSERNGGRRKPLILVPLAGRLVVDAALLANALAWRWPPLVAALAEALPYGVTGGQGVLNMGLAGYLADVTSREARTARIGVAMAAVFLGAPVGLSLGGALADSAAGLPGLFAACATIDAAAFAYCAARVPETGRRDAVCACAGTCACAEEKVGSCAGAVAGLARSLRVVAKPRKGYRRLSLLLVLLSTPFVVGPLLGETALLFLYVRKKFAWTFFEYGLYASFKMIVILIGTLTCMAVLCHKLKINDALIGIMCCSLQTIVYIVYSTINVGWVMYVATLLEFSNAVGITIHKSIVSKLVPPSEIAQVTAIVGMCEAMIPLFLVPIFSKVYQHTFITTPGAYYWLAASLAFPGVILFTIIFLLNRKSSGPKKDDDDTSTQKPKSKKSLSISTVNEKSNPCSKPDAFHKTFIT